MKRVKGCLNSNCKEYKKTYYKESDEYCVKCGTKLSYVCKHPKCFKQIPDDVKENYCPVHIAERKDKKEKRVKPLKKLVVDSLQSVVWLLQLVRQPLTLRRKNKRVIKLADAERGIEND